MTKEEVLVYWQELRDLVGECPRENSYAIDRIRRIRSLLSSEPKYNAYLNERFVSLVGLFEIWFSPRKWQKWDLTHLQGLINKDLFLLRRAIQDTFQGSGDNQVAGQE